MCADCPVVLAGVRKAFISDVSSRWTSPALVVAVFFRFNPPIVRFSVLWGSPNIPWLPHVFPRSV